MSDHYEIERHIAEALAPIKKRLAVLEADRPPTMPRAVSSAEAEAEWNAHRVVPALSCGKCGEVMTVLLPRGTGYLCGTCGERSGSPNQVLDNLRDTITAARALLSAAGYEGELLEAVGQLVAERGRLRGWMEYVAGWCKDDPDIHPDALREMLQQGLAGSAPTPPAEPSTAPTSLWACGHMSMAKLDPSNPGPGETCSYVCGACGEPAVLMPF